MSTYRLRELHTFKEQSGFLAHPVYSVDLTTAF